MPEYLSPGVYVEEVDLGPKPIEGVSTSTAGMVGVTERGPMSVSVLVTSFPEFRRIFGGYPLPTDHPSTWFFPYSVEGFFQNGGLRLYAVRVASANVATATVDLMDRGESSPFAAILLGAARENDRFLLVDTTAGLAAGDVLRIDDAAATEYLTFTAAGNVANQVVPLRVPAYATFGPTTQVAVMPNIDAGPAGAQQLASPAAAGANQITLDNRAGIGQGSVLRIDGTTNDYREYVTVSSVPADPSDNTVNLQQALGFSHGGGVNVKLLPAAPNLTAGPGPRTLQQGVGSGDAVLVIDAAAAAPGSGTVIRIGTGTQAEYHVVAPLEAVSLRTPASSPHPSGEQLAVLTLAAPPPAQAYSSSLAQAAVAGDTAVTFAELAAPPAVAPAPGDWFLVGAAAPEPAEIASVSGTAATLRQPLLRDHAVAPNSFVRQTPNFGAQTTLLQHLDVDGTLVLLADTAANFPSGTLVLVGAPTDPDREYRELGGTFTPALLEVNRYGGPGGAGIASGHHPQRAIHGRAVLLTIQSLDAGAWGNELRVKVEEEDTSLVQTSVAAAAPPGADVGLRSIANIETGTVLEIIDFSAQVAVYAAEGQRQVTLPNRAGLGPGDRLRIGRVDSEFVTILSVPANPADTSITLTEPLHRDHHVGEAVDRMDIGTGLPRLAKVARTVGPSSVRFEPAGLTFPVAMDFVVRSREFKLALEWVKRGASNPRTPNMERVVETETFRNLALDDRHSRYIGTVLGRVDGPQRLWDRRPDGASDLVRVSDPLFGTNQIRTTIRVGPDLIYEVLPSGRRRAVGRWLTGGDDDDAGLTDADYVGQDNVDPLQRTGLQALRNEEDISLVAVPGRISAGLQQGVIDQCEAMRYRMAVLDSVPGNPDSSNPGSFLSPAQLPEVQAQRRQFDTKYAAVYYPWLQVRNPMQGPGTLARLTAPPSGHMLGRYAHTDVTRGVHKAPANEVILGIEGLQRSLTKGEQDILNPSPMNINVLRDFREQTRGLRIWGARVITSDTEWKYVNVRRLFNYLERSIEIGTQWVVFEPNDENLWARVRRSITDFLEVVWRNGGLMGETADQAFFVKCDRTTMSQAQIDNGQLIVQIGVAPVKPAEFVIIRIGQWQGGSSVEEG